MAGALRHIISLDLLLLSDLHANISISLIHYVLLIEDLQHTVIPFQLDISVVVLRIGRCRICDEYLTSICNIPLC